jgi:hypothetical protein
MLSTLLAVSQDYAEAVRLYRLAAEQGRVVLFIVVWYTIMSCRKETRKRHATGLVFALILSFAMIHCTISPDFAGAQQPSGCTRQQARPRPRTLKRGIVCMSFSFREKWGSEQKHVTRGRGAEIVCENNKNHKSDVGSRIEQADFVFETTASQKNHM